MAKAFASKDADKWKITTNEEYESLTKNQTWTLTDLPLGCQPITSKWVFKHKLTSEEQISRYKVRLVIRGFSQKY